MTYYVGNWFEVTNGAVTKYYNFGAQRVAMWHTASVAYLHVDHLDYTGVTSSTSIVAYSAQTYVFGEVRTTSGFLPTDCTFKGQMAFQFQ